MSTDAKDLRNENDRVQLLQNLYGMIGEVNSAAYFAAQFAKATLEGATPQSVKTSGPDYNVLKLGLQALEAATAAAVAINDLSEKAVRLSQEIRNGQQLNE